MRLIYLVNTLFRLYYYILLARIVLSWVRVDWYHPVVQWIYRVTEPVLAPFRRVLPPLGGLDFSPIIALLVLQIVERLVIDLLRSIIFW